MAVDPMTIAAIAAAAAKHVGMGLSYFGIGTGEYDQTGGPSDEDIAAQTGAYRARRQRAAYEGARAAMQSAGGALQRHGMGRSGAVGAVAGRIGGTLGGQLGDIEAGAAGYESQLRSQRKYQYQPGWSELLAKGGAETFGQIAPFVYAKEIAKGRSLSTPAEAVRAAQAPAGGAPPASDGDLVPLVAPGTVKRGGGRVDLTPEEEESLWSKWGGPWREESDLLEEPGYGGGYERAEREYFGDEEDAIVPRRERAGRKTVF